MGKQEKIQWYNNPSLITWILIGIISLIILSSQSFIVDGNVSALKLVQNILNHNITYMIMLVYFIFLHTKFGKKYFDYSNVLMIIFLFIVFVTSILTMFQSFSLVALLTLLNNFLIFVYFFHTFLRGTRFWKEFNLNKSLFNELGNDWYFNAIVVIEVTLFAVGLISIDTVDGTFLATYDCVYVILFARYIYLYGEYLDSIKRNNNNPSGFEEFCEKVGDVASDVVEAAATKLNASYSDSEKVIDNSMKTDKDLTVNSAKKNDKDEDMETKKKSVENKNKDLKKGDK